MTGTVNISGGENLKEFLKNVKQQQARVDVGFFPESRYPDTGITVAQVAIDNEFGHVTESGAVVPARSFMHSTYQEQKNKWLQILAKVVQNQGKNIDVRKALTSVGHVAQDDVREKIDWWAQSGTPRNSEYTQKIKGFDSPLIWSGTMREAVSVKVTTK